jgi:drug/metabolite transporter (DMT)-like permease
LPGKQSERGGNSIKTIALTSFSLVAFAANSVLCRLALKEGEIDPASFTMVRLLAGVIVLMVILKSTNRRGSDSSTGNWKAALMLFIYAAAFSFAYVTLDTATGALILFGAVQLTMVFAGWIKGARLTWVEWLGMTVAFGGLVYLVLPGVTAPTPMGFGLMASAGAAWGLYTLMGRYSTDPLADTTYNFARSLPFLIALVAVTAIGSTDNFRFSVNGVLLAVISGGIASGIGYAIWYTALRGLSGTVAAVVQLAVPAIAALGGVVFVSESISQRLLISAAMTLGGIFLVTTQRHLRVST